MHVSYNCETCGKFQEYYTEEGIQEHQEFNECKECFDKSLED